jgi:thiosulfate/3-mercaptopyruvate sulfurtransferase
MKVVAIVLSLLPLILPNSARAATPWVVDADTAKSRVDAGALVLDARPSASFLLGHAEGAVRVTWQEFSRGKGAHHGKLRSRATLETKLRAKGVSNGRDVIVVGDPKKGWGEEGRIVWMLRSLGHERAMLVDGGHAALARAGVKVARGRGKAPAAGDFEATRAGAYTANRDRVRAAIGDPEVVIVDTRERREYDGKTPYGESRGGHVPGAKHLYFSDLLSSDGTLLSGAALDEKLASVGISKDTTVIAYCTGGIRSAHFTAALRQHGYDALNYAGSMWEWSDADAEAFPLETE